MSERLVLGLPPVRRHEPMEPDERALRGLTKAMARRGVEVTPELIAWLAWLVRHWPAPGADPEL